MKELKRSERPSRPNLNTTLARLPQRTSKEETGAHIMMMCGVVKSVSALNIEKKIPPHFAVSHQKIMFELSRLYYYTTVVVLLQLPTVVQSLTSGLFWSGDGTLHGYVAIYEGSSTNMAAVDVSLTSLPSAATGYAVSNGSSCSDIGSVLYQRSFSGTEFTESNEFDISAQTNNECPVYIYGSSGVLVCTMTGSALASSITKYPDATMPYNPSGYVIVGQNPGSCSSSTVSQTVYYNMRGLEASSSGGLHIHTGTQGCATSSTVGGHWWTPSTATDPWSTTYTSTNGTGATLGSFTVQYGFNITAAADHAVVVHAANGTRIGCGQLRVNSGSATLYEPYSQYDVCGTCGGSTTDSSTCAALGLTAYVLTAPHLVIVIFQTYKQTHTHTHTQTDITMP
jgi:hypothetical protein